MQPAGIMFLDNETCRGAFRPLVLAAPAGSAVFLKSRLRLYSRSAMANQFNHG